jgi:hypothetical protein
METLTGQFDQAANGRSTYAVVNAKSKFLFVIIDILQMQFGFSQPTQPILGLDQVISEISRGSAKLLLGWDVWSGCYIMANSSENDNVVKEIGEYLDSILIDEKYSEFIDER